MESISVSKKLIHYKALKIITVRGQFESLRLHENGLF